MLSHLALLLVTIQSPTPITVPPADPVASPIRDPLGDAPLVIYASLEPELCRPAVDRFKAANPNVAVELVELETRVALERIRGENASGRAVASVWWGGDDLSLHQAAAQGLLARSEPRWAAKLGDGERDESYLWCGQFLNPFAFVVRRGAAGAPDRFEDLADPRFRGRLLLRSPATSLPMQRFLGIVFAMKFPMRAGGERAMDWVAMVNANKVGEFYADDRLILDRLAAAGGDGDLSVMPAAEAARARDLDGLAIEFTVPADSPAFLEGIAKLANAPNPEVADKFLEFVGSDAEIPNYVRQARIPLAARAPGAAGAPLPAWMGPAAQHAILGDREALSENLPAWLPKIERRVRAGAAAVPEGDDPYAWVLNVVDVLGTLAIVGVLFVLVRRGRLQAVRVAPLAPDAHGVPTAIER
jgi:ABC-type Fe3+ transport system substrate-binding protein